jgi:hypothetical protein
MEVCKMDVAVMMTNLLMNLIIYKTKKIMIHNKIMMKSKITKD